ncbi:MAG: sigma-70 family RNA polymerase sigma factor [Planctomyces sp.]|nr:sigma-70 family RNA polymerase sigma factor [Planctomyces sp.]
MSHLETRKSLIVKLKDEHNDSAWRDFVCTYEGFLIRLVRRYGVPERHVPDVTQQILLAIAQSVEGWTDDGQPGSFRRWLATVSRNIVVRFMKRERKHIGGVGGSDLLTALQTAEAPPDQELIHRYEHELIVWVAEQVRHEFLESSWQAFWLTVIEGKPVEAVSKELNVSSGSIYMSRSRIMSRIRKKILDLNNP